MTSHGLPDVPAPRSALGALLAPASIAIVGASPREASLGGRPIANLRRQGYAGTLLPVNPRYERIGDLPCHADLLALPQTPDVALVLVGSERVFGVLDQCLQIGVRAAVLFAGGFAEVGEGGAALQRRLKPYAAQGLRICGPNSNGVFNLHAGVAMGFSPAFELPARPGGVALISQSGAIATGVSSRGMEMGLGCSHVVATGNEADLEVADFVEHLLDDARTTCFALFVEGFKDPARFLRVAEQALARGKPIVLLKVGQSASGRRVALSHTGSMAGSYDILVGALRQRGVVVVNELDELIGLAAVFAAGPPARPGGALALASLSGGMAALAADQCDAAAVPLAEFAPATRERLAAALPEIAHLANPLDVTGHVVNDPRLWRDCLQALNADPGIDALVAILSITANRIERDFAADLIAASAAGGPLQLAVWTSAAPAGSGIDLLRAAGVPVYLRCDDAVRAVAAWRRYWGGRAARLAALADAAAQPAPSPGPARSPWQWLADAGIDTARQVLARSRDDLQRALPGLRFPLALKAQSDAIAHKSELGLVRLGVGDAAAALRVHDELLAAVARQVPGAALDGVLVQEMVPGRRELILGMRHEPLLGPAIVLGLGGIFSEVLGDVAIRLAPLAEADVHEMVAELRSRALFDGVRGLAPVHMPAFVALVLRFARLALQHAHAIDEMEVNPLIVADDGTAFTAVDVLAVARAAEEPRS